MSQPEQSPCDFTPHDDQDDESWHFKRTCEHCGRQWYALHCQCDGRQNPCPECDIYPAPIPCPEWKEDQP